MQSLKSFFEPQSIAVIGASERDGSVSRVVLQNLLVAKDKRKIYPINPKKEEVLEIKSYPNVASLPETPEMAIIATPAKTVVGAVEECGKAGIKAIIIISAGFKETGHEGQAREEELKRLISEYGLRIIGPNCMGVIRPGANLNATFANKMPGSANVAFLSQSGALGSAVLDWAVSRDIGFSAFVSLGSMLDVDFGDLVDYFGEDRETKSIIIYLESMGNSLKNTRKFMSAVRGFARTKPIVIIKPGKYQESRKAAGSHTGAMVGEDLYYDAAFNRAGAVRVEQIEDLFNCAAILNTARLPKHPDLAIITNAGGPAVLATDALISRGGKLAQLGQQTVSALDEFLPPYWSKSNPIDILGDADAERYRNTIQTVIKDPKVNGIVVIFTPQGPVNPNDVAEIIVQAAKKTNKPILTTMMGSAAVANARQLLDKSKIPTYEFPEEAIRTYLYMYQYARNLEILYETPGDLPLNIGVPKNHLKILVNKKVRQGITLLNEEDSKKFLTTFDIPVTTPYIARSPEHATMLASDIGYPVVMKLVSPEISHKSDFGGVRLNITSNAEVKKTFNEMVAAAKEKVPGATIEGISVQKMTKDYDYELIIGSKKDEIMGPVILFGLGGTETEFFKDISVGLPPLNQILARRILERTRTYEMLARGFRTKPPVNLSLLDEILVKVSQLIVDFPELKELDINPLVIKDNVATALDARIILDAEAVKRDAREHEHLVITPYPSRYVQPWVCTDGTAVILRPIRPEDEPLEKELIAGLSEESSRFRFFHILREITHDMLTRYCNIDYEREMAIIAEYTSGGKRREVAVARIIMEPTGTSGEFAVLVADDFQDKGLGLKLVDMLIGIAMEKGLKSIYGIVLNDNRKMIGLAKKLGFNVERYSEEESKILLEIQ